MPTTRVADEPLILNLAPTGMVPTRSMSPHVPLQPDEIVADVLRAADAGITIAHLHARDGDLKPDMASLTLSSLNFSRQASVNAPDTVAFLAQRMHQRGIMPEVEIFDLGMVNVLRYLVERRLVSSPPYANLLFGNLATAQADLLEIGALVSRLPAGTVWCLAGLGAAQLPVAAIAAASAPGVRVGLEDNLWLDAARTQLTTNRELVERVHRLAELMGRRVMTPKEFRKKRGQ
jgi:uncharacterized protein (DUF849 family)